MENTSTIKAEVRTPRGKGGARELRRKGRLPAIIYGKDFEPVAIDIDLDFSRREIRRPGFRTRLYDIDLNQDSAIRVLPQAVAYHPVTDDPVHLDFLRVGPDTRVTVDVPVAFLNQEVCPGLKRGGVLNIVRRTINVNCPASLIPEAIEFDVADLEIGDSLHISHTELDPAVQPTIGDRDFTVASIVAPSALVSAATAEEEEEEEVEEGELEETPELEEAPTEE